MLLDRGADPNADPRGSALHTIAWLRKPGSDGAAGVGGTPQGTPVRNRPGHGTELAQKLLDQGANPNIRVEWKEPTFGKEGGTARNPPEHQARSPSSQLRRSDPFYVAAKNGDVPLMRPAGGPRRGRAHVDQGGHHAADGRGWSRLLGRREPGTVHRRHRGRASRGREAGGGSRQRRQRAREFRQLPHDGRRRVHAALLPAQHRRAARARRRRSALERQHAAHRRRRVRTAVDRAVPRWTAARSPDARDGPRLDAAPRRGGRVLRQREEGVSGRGRDSEEGARRRHRQHPRRRHPPPVRAASSTSTATRWPSSW